MVRYRWGNLVLALAMAISLVGCAARQEAGPSATPAAPRPVGVEYVRKVDEFLVIFDASSSMFDAYKGKSKFAIAKDMITQMNGLIPDLELQGGLRVFGPYNHSFNNNNNLLYGLSRYESQAFQAALARVDSTQGITPLAAALNEAGKDLVPARGKMAVIIFSDGLNTGSADPIAAGKELARQYGERLCLYPVLIGDDYDGYEMMKELAKVSGCGFAVMGGRIGGLAGMTEFVEAVFLEKKTTASKSSLPSVKELAAMVTPPPLTKDVNIELHVEFDFDKAVIKKLYSEQLQKAADFLRLYPDLRMVIEGHTDNVGSAKYNQKLSQQRAEAIVDYLCATYGIAPGRLTAVGYGLAKPVADNRTEAGRRKNRRAVAVLKAKVAPK